jgi:hypothetical protein
MALILVQSFLEIFNTGKLFLEDRRYEEIRQNMPSGDDSLI